MPLFRISTVLFHLLSIVANFFIGVFHSAFPHYFPFLAVPGVMLGKLEVEGGGEVSSFSDPNERNLVSEVSIAEPRVFGKGNPVKVRLQQNACFAKAIQIVLVPNWLL